MVKRQKIHSKKTEQVAPALEAGMGEMRGDGSVLNLANYGLN
jgi:hypothetical protein